MKMGKEGYLCDKCKYQHNVDYYIAENEAEYNSVIFQLPRPFAEAVNGDCRRMRRCGINDCEQDNGELILSKGY